MAIYNSRGNITVTSTDSSGRGIISSDGKIRVTVVSGSTLTGLYAADGSYNVVVVSSSATPVGLYHTCGAIRVVETASGLGVYAPNGAWYVTGTFVLSDTEAKDLMGDELQGLTFSAGDQSMAILDTTNPSNNYDGELSAKLGSIRTSAGMTYLSSGLLGWGPENLLVRSAQFDLWSATRASASQNAATAPNGTLTAEKFVEDSSASTTHFIRNHLSGTNDTLAPLTFSVYLKAAERSWVRLMWDGTGGLSYYFNISTGTVGTGGGGNVSNPTVTSVGDGWYRCSITVVPISASLAFEIYSATGDSGANYSGNGASGFYMWGAQVERASSASTYKPTTSAAYYGLRLDYDSRLTGGPGYLVEEARTNIALRSQEFDNASWTKVDTTVTADNTTAPDGTSTADLLTVGTAGTEITYQDLTVSSGATMAWSVYLKRGNNDWVRLYVGVPAGTDGILTYFNLNTGATGTTTVVGTGSAGSIAIQSVGNGWYRCSMTGAVAGQTTYRFSTICCSGDANNTRVNNATRYQWGAQAEAGTFPTSYIPTTTASVTRAADAGSILATMFPIGASGNTTYARFAVSQLTGRNNVIFNLCKDDASTYQLLRTDTAQTKIQNIVVNGGLVANIIPSPDITPFTYYRAALGASTNSFQAAMGGVLGTEDTAGVHPTIFDGLRFGTFAGNPSGLVWLSEGAVYPRRFSNVELQAKAA